MQFLLLCSALLFAQDYQDLGDFNLRQFPDGHYELIPLVPPPPDPPVEPPFETYSTTFADLTDWVVISPTIASDGVDLTATNGGRTELERQWARSFQVKLDYAKNNRYSDLLLPGGYYVRFGGRDTAGGGVVQKYGTNISLHNAAGQIKLVGSAIYVVYEPQTLTVQVLADQIRVYLQRVSDGKFLHADTAWRTQPGPVIVHELTEPIWATWNNLGIRAFNTPSNGGGLHRYYALEVIEPVEFEGEAYYPPTEVPPPSEDGLSLPLIPAVWGHAGLAFRGDGAAYPVDNPNLLNLVSFAPFGPPPGEDGLGYIAATVWTTDSWAAWSAWCQTHNVVPDTGKLGNLSYEPGGVPPGFAGGSEIGVVNLASPDVRAHIKERAASLAAGNNQGIFFDVTIKFTSDAIGFNLPYTDTEWADLQGTLYREIWKDILSPVGKWPMINGGNAKTDRNRRLMEWIPILYMDRQINGDDVVAEWSWYEQTVLTNPAYRQGVFGNEWISVLDSIGGDAACLNQDVKYGWLTAYYHRLATLGGFNGRHFLAGGFNGDWDVSGNNSGRHKWEARHYVPACAFDLGQPTSATTIANDFSLEIGGKEYRNKLFQATFQNGTVYHLPNYRANDYSKPDWATAPPYLLAFTTPHDVLQFDGTWLCCQMTVTIPAGSGRIVRPTPIMPPTE